MYTASAPVADPSGPHLFLCLGCDTASDETICACGWSTCDCVGCRQSLRLERYDRWTFDYQSDRGMLAIGCAGGSKPPETAPAPAGKVEEIKQAVAEASAAEPAAPAEPPVPPAPFRALLRMCGLSHAEAAIVLRQSESAVKKKSSGSLAMTSADRTALRTVWNRICRGDLEGLQPGSVEAAAALRALQD